MGFRRTVGLFPKQGIPIEIPDSVAAAPQAEPIEELEVVCDAAELDQWRAKWGPDLNDRVVKALRSFGGDTRAGSLCTADKIASNCAYRGLIVRVPRSLAKTLPSAGSRLGEHVRAAIRAAFEKEA